MLSYLRNNPAPGDPPLSSTNWDDKSTMTHNMRHVPAGAKKAETRAQTGAVASAPTFRPTRGLREAMLNGVYIARAGDA